MGRNVDEGALFAHTILYNKISLKIHKLRSILRVLKGSSPNRTVPLRRTTKTTLGLQSPIGVCTVKISLALFYNETRLEITLLSI